MPTIAAVSPRDASRAPDHSARLTLRTRGECRIVVAGAGGTTTLTPESDRLFTLALLLAAEPGRDVPRARAAAWLWPDLSPPGARHALRQLVYRLRRLGVTVDGDDAHLAVPAASVAHHTALAGRCLPDWHPAGDALAAWVDRYRATVDAATRAALARALADARATNRDDATLAAALLELDPQHPLARTTLAHATRTQTTTARAIVRESRPTHALPYVGRDATLGVLRTHAAAAAAGCGTTLVLTASPGAGVTRLLEELATVARTLGVTVATAPQSPRSFAPALAATLPTLLGAPGALGCGPDALRTLRRFHAAPILPAGDAAVRRLGAAAADLARAVAAERPLLLALDAPCATPPERVLAAAIARAVEGAPVLAVFVSPPLSTSTALGALTTVAQVVPLPTLEDGAAATLATAAAGTHGATLSPDDLGWCITMARRHPGDVIALAHACAARPGTRTLPPALATRLHHHVAALPTRTREVAATLALLGDAASPDRAARALDRRRIAVDAALAELHRAHLAVIPTTNPTPGSQRDARQAVGAAVFATFDPAQRAALHARGACAL